MKFLGSIRVVFTLLILCCYITGCGFIEPEMKNTSIETGDGQQTTITFFTTLPNREAGQGLLEQTLIDQYVEENPNIVVEVEALQGEPYKKKFRTYVASNALPDLLAVWGQPSFLEAAIKNDYLAELDAELFSEYQFIEGSMTDFTYEGKLYGLPGSRDVTVIYYNQDLFETYGVKLPSTVSELQEAAKVFNENNIEAIATNGQDKWILNLFFQDLVIKVSGNQSTIYDAVNQKTTFSQDQDIRQAAEIMETLIKDGLFQTDFMSADYETAKNLFLKGKAAMYYMGGWEVGMAANQEVANEITDNIRVLPFPTIEGGKGDITDLYAWYGGGYSVASNSEVKEETMDLLAYMLEGENWAKIGWETSTVIPPHTYDTYITGEENEIQNGVINVLQSATSVSGTPWNDYEAGEWKSDVENIIRDFASGILSVDEYLEALDQAAAKEE